jgi:hypothetical protein
MLRVVTSGYCKILNPGSAFYELRKLQARVQNEAAGTNWTWWCVDTEKGTEDVRLQQKLVPEDGLDSQ